MLFRIFTSWHFLYQGVRNCKDQKKVLLEHKKLLDPLSGAAIMNNNMSRHQRIAHREIVSHTIAHGVHAHFKFDFSEYV